MLKFKRKFQRLKVNFTNIAFISPSTKDDAGKLIALQALV
jgi:hypothetical protein